MSLHTSVYNSLVTIIACFMYEYHLKRVTQTTEDLLTTTLPLNNSTTIVGGGQIDAPTSRLCEPYK